MNHWWEEQEGRGITAKLRAVLCVKGVGGHSGACMDSWEGGKKKSGSRSHKKKVVGRSAVSLGKARGPLGLERGTLLVYEKFSIQEAEIAV